MCEFTLRFLIYHDYIIIPEVAQVSMKSHVTRNNLHYDLQDGIYLWKYKAKIFVDSPTSY